MPKSITRAWSRHTREATSLLGRLIRANRLERGLTAQEVAERAGISRGLLQRIEKGDLKCEIGTVFEAATIVGVALFHADEGDLSRNRRQVEERLALLPRTARKSPRPVSDDF